MKPTYGSYIVTCPQIRGIRGLEYFSNIIYVQKFVQENALSKK